MGLTPRSSDFLIFSLFPSFSDMKLGGQRAAVPEVERGRAELQQNCFGCHCFVIFKAGRCYSHTESDISPEEGTQQLPAQAQRPAEGLTLLLFRKRHQAVVTDPATNYRPEKSLDLISVRAWLTSPSRYHGLTLLPLLSFKIHCSWCMGAEQRPSLPGTIRVFPSQELR